MDEKSVRRKKLIRDGAIILVSIIAAVLIHRFNYLENLLRGSYGIYFALGAFLTGIFFASTFTVAIAASVFWTFGQTHNPFVIALIGGLGAFVGDSFIFKFLKDDLIADFKYLEKFFPQRTAKRILHSKLILWFAPIMAAIVIASPLPDEIGLLMLAGISLKYHQFFMISYFLNTIGILIISLFGKFI